MRKLLGTMFSRRALLAGAPAAALALALGVVVVRNVTMPPTSVSEDPREPRDLIVHINGTDEPIVDVDMAEGAPLVIEFPAADELYATHFGYTGVAEISNRVGAGEHQLVLHAGSDFPTADRRPAAEDSATDDAVVHDALEILDTGGRAVKDDPVELDGAPPDIPSDWRGKGGQAAVLIPRDPEPATTIHVQTRSGAALTLRVYAVASVEFATRRCVVSYDPEQVSRARAKEGLATGLK